MRDRRLYDYTGALYRIVSYGTKQIIIFYYEIQYEYEYGSITRASTKLVKIEIVGYLDGSDDVQMM